MLRPLLSAARQDEPRVEPSAPSTTFPARRRPPVAAACDLCRHRKSRCDGARPRCAPCQKRNTPCQYQTGPKETSLQAFKRKLGELQQKSNEYEELFRILATKTHGEASGILDRIRRGHSVQSILRHVQEADLLLQLHLAPDVRHQYSFPYCKDMPAFLTRGKNPYLDCLLYNYSSFKEQPHSHIGLSSGDPVMYQVPYHAAEIVDPRLNALSAKKWTSIVDDDALVSTLLQVYFLTEYTWYPAFQKDYFLDDMTTGDKRYCSSLLVNAILASACHGYSKSTNRAEFWNPRTLGYQFLAEARRLWELEAGNARLTTVQAAIVLSITYDANGSDKIGNSYLAQAILAAHSMQLFSPPQKSVDQAEYNVRAITAWSLFGIQAVHSFHVYKAPLLATPPSIPLPDASGDSNYYGEFWLKYPIGQNPVPVSYSSTFKAIAEFRVIMNDVAVAFFSDVKGASTAAINSIQMFCARLDTWFHNLPADLTTRAICFPWQLKLHMHYYNLVIYLLETLSLASKLAGSDVSVVRTLNDARIRLETLLRLYYLRHGFESYDLFMVQLLSFLGFMQLKTLESAESTEIESRRSSVALAAQGLREQSQSCYLADLVFGIMRDKMGVEGQRLLKDIAADWEKDEGRAELIAEQVHSSWPIDIQWIDVAADQQRLENLVKKTGKLGV